MKIMSLLVAVLTAGLAFHFTAKADEAQPMGLPHFDVAKQAQQAPTLGIGMDNRNQPTFFIYSEANGYQPASASSVKSMFDRLMRELSTEICQARFRPDYVTVSGGVMKVQWDVNNVCKGRRQASQNTKTTLVRDDD